MNALERKAMRLFEEIGVNEINKSARDKKKIVRVNCVIRWKDGTKDNRDINITSRALKRIDDDFFFHVSDVGAFISLLANLDFVYEDFDSEKEWLEEIAKYEEDDKDDYFNSREDFDIIDVNKVEILDNMLVVG